jgi:uncharacterized membrane protein YgdD (TMEM256/DUF423 family)
MERTVLIIAAALGFAGVALGAFGAHALRAKVPPERLVIFETGVRYLMYHALALIGVAWLVSAPGARTAASLAAWSFLAGVVLFSGSLFALTLTGQRRWGAVTPIGGLAFLVGWAAVLWAGVAARF